MLNSLLNNPYLTNWHCCWHFRMVLYDLDGLNLPGLNTTHWIIKLQQTNKKKKKDIKSKSQETIRKRGPASADKRVCYKNQLDNFQWLSNCPVGCLLLQWFEGMARNKLILVIRSNGAYHIYGCHQSHDCWPPCSRTISCTEEVYTF